jgi:hypothetical protein
VTTRKGLRGRAIIAVLMIHGLQHSERRDGRWCIVSGSLFLLRRRRRCRNPPPTQSSQTRGEQSIEAFYDAVPTVDATGQPNGVLKLKGTLRFANHNDIGGQPKCVPGTPFCDIGVFGYLGYPTAWLAYQLGLDPSAKAAFVSGSGEMFQQRSHWQHVQSNVQ